MLDDREGFQEAPIKTTSLLDSVHVVKENEKKAAEFYADAAEKAGSTAGRELFGELAKFENYHYHWLTVLEKSLNEKGITISYEGREFSLPPVLEPQAAEEPRHRTVLDIISRALELERQAEKAYSDLAAGITDPQGRAMFKKLSAEEHNHFRILQEASWGLENGKAWRWHP
jgi:rubrerythrin